MLPLAGEKLALQDKGQGAIFVSGCIVTAQLVMVPMAIVAGFKADGWGRRPLLLVAFAVLSLRGCLYLVSDDRNWLLATQILDGIRAGLYLTLLPVVIGDLTRGTGHYNLALGAVITAQNVGAALSTSLAGFVAVQMSHSAAFLVLAGIATIGLILCYFGMPETADFNTREPGKTVPGLSPRSYP
jgi:MFS family permease